ncbi:hypothetical protein GCM10009733_099820 [Nonomuraea maheshkhaliensis]|uniref:Uncharacterized protein n=1 Tax=Nonomuraea maheshkhaliensis TaxID=419590 RepID=A0ABN2HHP0_9ACTN
MRERVGVAADELLALRAGLVTRDLEGFVHTSESIRGRRRSRDNFPWYDRAERARTGYVGCREADAVDRSGRRAVTWKDS